MPFDEKEASRLEAEELPGPSELESALINDTLADVVTQAPLILEGATSLADAIHKMREERRAQCWLSNPASSPASSPSATSS